MNGMLPFRLLITCVFAAAATASEAVSYVVSGEAGCKTIPGATWDEPAKVCTLGADLSVNSGDVLSILRPAAVAVPSGIFLVVNGGALLVFDQGRLFMSGGGMFYLSGRFENEGIVSISDASSAIVTSEGSVLNNAAYIHIIAGRFDNYGTLNQNPGFAMVQTGRPGVFRNFGLLSSNVSSADVRNEGRFENYGAIVNHGEFVNRCGQFANAGSYSGNALIDAYCWRGANLGAWSTPSNWNHGSVPPPGGYVVIGSGNSALLDASLAFSGQLDIDFAELIVPQGITLTNQGNVYLSATLRNRGLFINQGRVVNGGDLVNDTTGTLSNMGLVDSAILLGKLTNLGTWGNQPAAEVQGQGLDNRSTGLMVNYGNMQFRRTGNENAGRFINFTEGDVTFDNALRNRTGGQVFNFGRLRLTHALNFPSGIDNEAGARVQNEPEGTILITAAQAYVNNAGLVRNDGAISNGGIFNNPGVVCGTGTVSGNAIAGNAPVSACFPSANAGADKSVGEGTLVVLDGSASSTPKGTALTYQWAQTAGPPVSLGPLDPARRTFTAPYVPATTVLSFSLRVNDGYDTSLADFVDVFVASTNSPPVADAGDDQTSKPGLVVTLDSAHSYDPDGDAIVSRQWTQVSGPAVALVPGPTAANPSFTVPTAVGSVLVFKLAASDGKESSVPSGGVDPSLADTVAVTIVENSPPIARVSPDRAVGENSLVVLDGAASSDNDAGDVLSYQWRQVSGPAVSLANATTATPSFTAPFVVAGSQTTLEFELIVNDNDPINPLSSQPRIMKVGIYNVNDPPRCDLAAPSVASLSPPDLRMETVGITGVIDDGASGLPFTLRITGVRQDEPVSGLTPADPSPDAVIVAAPVADSVQLRRERDPRGNGRVYAIAYTADDGWEGCSGVLKVQVPRTRNDTAVDDGPSYDSTGG